MMCLMFSNVVTRLKCNMSLSDSGLFKLWLISNMGAEYTGKPQQKHRVSLVCGNEDIYPHAQL